MHWRELFVHRSIDEANGEKESYTLVDEVVLLASWV
jgi:hypothetical protein